MTDRALIRARDQDSAQAALSAFVRITEAAATTEDHVTLAELTIGVLQDLIPHADHAYNVLEDAVWKNRAISPNVPPALASVMRAGMSTATPQYVQLFDEARPILSEWNAALAKLPDSAVYSSAGFFPLWRDGQPLAFLGTGITELRPWSEGERLVFLAAGRALQLALDRAWQAQEAQDRITALERRQRALEASVGSAGALRDPAQVIETAERALLSALPGAAAQYWAAQDDAWHVQSQRGPFRELHWDVLDGESRSSLVHAPRQLPRQQSVHVHGTVQGVLEVTLPGTEAWSAAARAVLETVATHLGLALERTRDDAVSVSAMDAQARYDEGDAFALGVWRDARHGVQRVAAADDRTLRRLDRLLADAELLRRPLRLGLVALRLLVEDVQRGLLQGDDVTWHLGELRPVRADREVLQRVLRELMAGAVRFLSGERAVEVWSSSDLTYRVVSVRSAGVILPPVVRAALVDGVWGPLEGSSLATARRLIERHGGRMWAEVPPGQGMTVSFTLPG